MSERAQYRDPLLNGMMVTIGRYTFRDVSYREPWDMLELKNEPGDLAICDYETSDGDAWFVRTPTATAFSGIEVNNVIARLIEGPLIVEAPNGKRYPVDGIDGLLTRLGP